MAGTYNPFYNIAKAITKSDTVSIIQPSTKSATDALYVGGAGDIVAVMPNSEVITFKGALAGTIIPIAVTRVNNTNSTATDLVALYTI